MDKITLVLLASLILCWSFNPFLKKKAIGNLSSDESLVLTQCLHMTILCFYFVYLFITKKCDLAKYTQLTTKEIFFNLLSSLITAISAIILIKLLQRSNVSYLIPQIQPIVILLSILIGIFIFKEKLTITQIIGCILVITGVWFLNKNKK